MLDEIIQAIANCRRCVVLTGAGISAESGVPTFRGKEGLWGKFKPEELATMHAFVANSKIVWEWYNWRRQLLSEVKPNPGHYALKEMEKLFDRFILITQNVDGLHAVGGSSSILELHGNITKNKCIDCNRPFDMADDIDPAAIPVCENCGGKIRPDVVWFGEMLDSETIDRAFTESESADLFFSIGTSALIHPAASLPVAAKRSGATLIEINTESTPLTGLADYFIDSCSGEVLPQIVEQLRLVRGN